MDRVAKLASQKAVAIFSKSSCCMCHEIKRLFYELGVSPAILSSTKTQGGRKWSRPFMGLGCNQAVPAVFIGGKFVGSTDTIITLYLNGSLKNRLKNAGV